MARAIITTPLNIYIIRSLIHENSHVKMDIFLTPERDGSVLMSKCGSIPVSVEGNFLQRLKKARGK